MIPGDGADAPPQDEADAKRQSSLETAMTRLLRMRLMQAAMIPGDGDHALPQDEADASGNHPWRRR